MSIAISALIKPSRVQRALLCLAGLALAAAAATLGREGGSHYRGAPVLALLPALAAALLLLAAARPAKAHRIDISDTGDLSLTVQQDVGEGSAIAGTQPCATSFAAARLLPGSVVWPRLMVLRWTQAGGAVRVLLVWRDAVEPSAWRALSVALGVMGRRMDVDAQSAKLR